MSALITKCMNLIPKVLSTLATHIGFVAYTLKIVIKGQLWPLLSFYANYWGIFEVWLKKIVISIELLGDVPLMAWLPAYF